MDDETNNVEEVIEEPSIEEPEETEEPEVTEEPSENNDETDDTDDTEEDEQLIALRKRLPGVDDDTLEILLEDSKNIALNELFPFEDILPTELPKKYLNWQLRVCEYMYKHKDLIGVKEYAENEISITFTSDNIPKSFMNELVPYAGAVKPKYVEPIDNEG